MDNRNVEVEAAQAKLREIRQKKEDSDALVTALESNFLSEFQGNYNSAKAIALKNEIEGMKKALDSINTEIANLEKISSGYVQSTQNVDEA